MKRLKNRLGWVVISLLAISPIISWGLMLPIDQRFSDWERAITSFGQMAGLVAIVLLSLNFILSARLKIYEEFFGGMNKVYLAHHIVGGLAFVLFMLHPLLFALARFSSSWIEAALFLLPGSDLAINFGIAALLSAMAILIITFFAKFPYQVWLWTHRLLGITLVFSAIHVLLIPSDVSTNAVLKGQILIFVSLGLGAYVYRTVLGKFLIRREKYQVSEVKKITDEVVEIELSPVTAGEAIKFYPGQFIFLSFVSKAVSGEVHPFSITSGPNSGGVIKLVVKSEGDYTEALKRLKVGDQALVEGSFGKFTYSNFDQTEQIWIGGGIGITPFLGMARDLKNHPEYRINLYYSVREEVEAVYLEELKKISIRAKLKVNLWISSKMGRLSAAQIQKDVGQVFKKEILICGPNAMMGGLRYDFRRLGASNDQIHTEEFNLQ